MSLQETARGGGIGRAARFEWLIKLGIFVLPFVLMARLVFEKITNPWNFWAFVQEDAPVEWLTAGIYIIAVPIAVILAYRLRKQGAGLHALLVAGLAFAMFFVGMEEFSWGQRILGIETPEILVEANLQEEANLHNLILPSTLQTGFLLIGLYGLLASHVMPALLRPLFGEQAQLLADLISPPGFLKSYFFITFFIQALFFALPLINAILGTELAYGDKPVEGHFLLSRDREYSELTLAMGLLFFSAWLLVLQVRGRWSHEPEQG